jgi:hypothetical protein
VGFVRDALALVVVVVLAAALAFALPRIDDLRSQVPRIDGASIPDPTQAAANGALAFAREAARRPASTQGGARFAFTAEPPPGTSVDPGHWCADQTIGYRIDYTAALRAGSTRARELYRWRKAVREWSRASGGRYRFAYRGAAGYPVVADGPDSAPVDLATVPAGEIALTYAVGDDRRGAGGRGYRHAALSDALGVGGVENVTWTGPDAGLIRRGMVVLDAVDVVNDPRDLPTAYVHELGHALGLGHVDDRAQMMTALAGPDARIGAGDRRGITRLATGPC